MPKVTGFAASAAAGRPMSAGLEGDVQRFSNVDANVKKTDIRFSVGNLNLGMGQARRRWGGAPMARMGQAAAGSGSRFQGQEAEWEDGVTPLLTRAIECAKAGDREAIVFLYARYAEDVCHYAQSVLGDAGEAEELTLRVFAELPLAIGDHRARDAPFLAWLLRLARQIIVAHIRERHAIRLDLAGRSGLGLGALPEAGRSGRWVDAVREALATLPFDEHEVLVLRHFGGLSPVDIARLTGRSERRVRGLQRSGREALRSQLGGQRALQASAGS